MADGVVRAERQKVNAVKADLNGKAEDILASVDALRATYDREVIQEQGLVGTRADRLTDWFTAWHNAFKTKTQQELTDFSREVESAAADILAAGGEEGGIFGNQAR